MTKNIRGEVLPRARSKDFGQLKHLVHDPWAIPTDVSWTGRISVTDRVEKGRLTRQQIQDALRDTELDKYYITATKTERMRCIDGRVTESYNELPSDRPLGPQVPGGTAAAALCWRVASWGSIHTKGFTLSGDINTLSDILHEAGFQVGGHIDDHAPKGLTGCGAIDKIPDILHRVTTPESQEQVRGILRALLGDLYDRDITDMIVGRLVSLQGKQAEYFDRDERTGNLRYREAAIKTLREQNPEGVARLTGTHHEIALVVNTVKGTTFDQDKFATDHHNVLQIFNYDFWSTMYTAEKLFPDPLQSRRYITCWALFAIGTAMVLTDGTVELIVRSAVESEY